MTALTDVKKFDFIYFVGMLLTCNINGFVILSCVKPCYYVGVYEVQNFERHIIVLFFTMKIQKCHINSSFKIVCYYIANLGYHDRVHLLRL